MESVVIDGPPPVKTQDSIPEANNNNDSVGNFQKFIYELFERNGVLNDLRAYLRSHIVDVIKNAQTGDPPACQKHFTQRLELTYQALNMLIVEYLICLEFSYSLSVFLSEIPLANMVFGFAQTLLQSGDSDHLQLRFSDSDVWSVLNYLGVKCDSVHASNIVDTYRNEEKSPLLLCILKCMPLYNTKNVSAGQVPKSRISSSESLPSTTNNSDTDKPRYPKNNGLYEDKCRHYACCKMCQAKLNNIKDKYKTKKKTLCKNIKDTTMNPLIGENLMKNINAVEKTLIDEMFQQLKTVYEAEIEMVKKEEEKNLKRSLAFHAMQLQKYQDELEEAFKVREEELERNVQQKKKFLWGLAKALREQHTQMSQAMNAVKNETERLSAKEDTLKTQLIEAESILRKRGEEMRSQISNELTILEDHLESMKRERDSIHKERRDFENYKSEYDNILSINKDMKSHYDLLKNELGILKKYIDSTKMEPRCVIEKSTLTELCDVTSKINVLLNNEQDADRNLLRSDSEDRASRTPNQVVNNLKKQKNVNFSNPPLDVIYQERVSRDRSRSPPSSDFQPDGTVLQLREENHRLKTFARQQRQHIDELNRQQARLQSELTAAQLHADCTPARPRTAPCAMPQYNLFADRLGPSASANCFGWRKGAGEELSIFSNGQPHMPGDAVPFVGVLRDRQTDYRSNQAYTPPDVKRLPSPINAHNTGSVAPALALQLLKQQLHRSPNVYMLLTHMISHWRSLRRRVSPANRRAGHERPPLNDTQVHPAPTVSVPHPTHILEAKSTQETSETYIMQPQYSHDTNIQRPHTVVSTEMKSTRDKSPKSVLREAKLKLRNKDKMPRNLPHETNREKSPNSVLREAKLRLRKLEIEAEAVEKSYLDFKKRQLEKNEGRDYTRHEGYIAQDVKLDIKHNKSVLNLNGNHLEIDLHPNYISVDSQQSIKNDIDKYIRNYQTKFNITAVSRTRPMPEIYTKIDKQDKDTKVTNNYLETPLTEFRKLYHTQKPSMPFTNIDRSLGITNRNAEKIETPRNRENMAPTEQQLSKNLNAEKIESQKTNDNCAMTMNDQELSRTVNTEHVDSERNNAQNKRNIVCPTITYPEAERNENNKITSNKEETYDWEDKPVSEADNDTQIKNRQAELEILKDNLSKMYGLQDTGHIESEPTMEHVTSSMENEIQDKTNENNLRIEVESVSESNCLKITDSQPQELMLVVQSSVESRNMSTSELEEQDKISTRMTIIVSPKSLRSEQTQSPKKSLSPRSYDHISENQPSKLTQSEILDQIFHSDTNKQLISSTEIQPEVSKKSIEDSISENEKDDDFSADVDNYNSRSEYENNSPISMPKTSEDENFWDS